MGYRNPGYDEPDDRVSEFEWDGDRQRWLFRRRGRAAPILISHEEKERYDSIQRRGKIVVMTVFLGLYVFSDYWIGRFFPLSEKDIGDLRMPVALILGLPICAAGYALIDWVAIRRLGNRAPQGPERTRSEVWQAQIEQKSWLDYIAPAAVLIGIVWIHWRREGPGDWAWLAIAGLVAAYFFYEVAMRTRAKRL